MGSTDRVESLLRGVVRERLPIQLAGLESHLRKALMTRLLLRGDGLYRLRRQRPGKCRWMTRRLM